MIKELGITNETNWNETVQIELSLAELQIIYDCVGAVPIKYLNLKHKDNIFYNKYDATMFNNIYTRLDDILFRHNGLTDNESNVNIDIELSIVQGDE